MCLLHHVIYTSIYTPAGNLFYFYFSMTEGNLNDAQKIGVNFLFIVFLILFNLIIYPLSCCFFLIYIRSKSVGILKNTRYNFDINSDVEIIQSLFI